MAGPGKSPVLPLSWQPFLPLLERLRGQFALGEESPHGPRHWARVARYGELLAAQAGGDATVVALFSLFHDCRRQSEGHDSGHGARGAELARHWCGSAFELEAERLELLCLACVDHTAGYTSQDATVGACWDADRLELDRVGVDADPVFMSTNLGRELAFLPAAIRHERVGLRAFHAPQV